MSAVLLFLGSLVAFVVLGVAWAATEHALRRLGAERRAMRGAPAARDAGGADR